MKYVGTMTGTSIDGLDIALLEIDARLTVAAAETVPLPDTLAAGLKALTAPGENEVERVGAADAALGEFTGEAVMACLAGWRVAATEVRAIGSHGQTIRHRPDATPPFTVQIGDANRIAEITGIDTVADFRRRDVAAGGQGAPLAPLFHEALFRDASRHRMVLNVGGIANVTLLPAASQSLVGFDTGPGNALMDAWMQETSGVAYDRDGDCAARGEIEAVLLRRLQQDPYLRRAPPKSTGKEVFHLGYVRAACAGLSLAPQDVQATLAEFTAWSVADAIGRWGLGDGEVLVCGGGRRNAHLMRRLAANLPNHTLRPTEDVGIDGDFVEAAAFAWFAHRTVTRQPANAPTVTGASGARVLGAVYAGAAKDERAGAP